MLCYEYTETAQKLLQILFNKYAEKVNTVIHTFEVTLELPSYYIMYYYYSLYCNFEYLSINYDCCKYEKK